MSVTDRFLAELGPVAMGQVSKDASPRYENLVKGLKHIKIKVGLYPLCIARISSYATNKVWPPEAFEEDAEFMESLSKAYANAHGQLKTAFVEVLIALLHPIGKVGDCALIHPVAHD